ncbi:MAG: stalk domain-containing protein [Bacillota bacterium]
MMLAVFAMPAQARPLMPGDPEVRIIKFQIGSKQYTVQDGTGPAKTVEMDVAPYLKQVGSGYRVMMPFRYVGEAMGASKVEYLPVTPSHPVAEVIIQRPIKMADTKEFGPGSIANSTIIVTPGTKEVSMNLMRLPDMDVATEIIDGRTFIPLRAAAQGLGGLVFWESKTQTVTILTPNIPIPSALTKLEVDGKTFFVDRATITKNSNKVATEYFTLKTKTTLTTEHPILQPSPRNPKLYVIDAIQVFKTMFGPVSDQQILVDPVRKAVMLANGDRFRPFAQIYITSTGEGDYWIGPTQVRTTHSQNSMFDKKAYMTPDGRILTELTGFDVAIAIFDHKDEIKSFDGTTLVADIKFNL